MNGLELLMKMDLAAPIFVEAADKPPKRQRKYWIPATIVAACLCVVATILLFVPQSQPGTVQPLTRPALWWPTEPAIHEGWNPQYNNVESYISGARLYIPGYYTQALTDTKLNGVLPDSLSGSGQAGFDENGELVDVTLTIEADPPVNIAIGYPRDYVVDGELANSVCGDVTYVVCRWENGEKIMLMADAKINGILCSFTLTTDQTGEEKARILFDHILWEYAQAENILDLTGITPD